MSIHAKLKAVAVVLKLLPVVSCCCWYLVLFALLLYVPSHIPVAHHSAHLLTIDCETLHLFGNTSSKSKTLRSIGDCVAEQQGFINHHYYYYFGDDDHYYFYYYLYDYYNHLVTPSICSPVSGRLSCDGAIELSSSMIH